MSSEPAGIWVHKSKAGLIFRITAWTLDVVREPP